MAEAVSSFSVYNKSPTRKKDGTKTTGKNTARGKSANTKTTVTKTATKSGTKKTDGAANSKTNNKGRQKAAEKGAAKPRATAKSKTTKAASAVSSKAAGNGKSSTDINDDNLFELMDELLYSPKNRKLTKEQEKKKKDLEAYLNHELETAKKQLGVEEEDSEFSEEYTLNSSEYSDEDTSTSESDSNSQSQTSSESVTHSNSDGDSGESSLGKKDAPQNKNKTTKSSEKNNSGKNQANKGHKRKSVEARTTNENASGATQDLKTLNTGTLKNKSSAPKATECNGGACKRRSTGGSSTQAKNHSDGKSEVKLEPLSPPNNVAKMNSVSEGLKVFAWLLAPISVDDFYSKYWERNACLVRRQQASYFNNLISFEAIDQMLLKNHVEFTKNIDVTSYTNGVRKTLNPDGRALPPVVWEHYGNGCSIRLLNPQTFLQPLYRLNATLQEYFHCLVGANAYLTPPNSQGFAPHYDDIEAFVLQIEGRKRWKLYKPRSKSEQWPRFSSRNFKQDEIGKPILEEVLQPGDILYFPRGTIHQAFTEPGYHSLHITLSVYQKQSYADLFEKIMPLILQHAINNNTEMRRGLPLNIWQNAGIAFSEVGVGERQQLIDTISLLLSKTIREVPLADIMDAAVDQLAKRFQHEALPPEILPAERERTIFGSRTTVDEHGECLYDYEIDLRTNVRLLRANIMRLVNEEDKIRIYYHINNSKEYCGHEASYIEIQPEEAGSVEVLIKSYPAYVSVSQLPIQNDEHKITMVTALWESGLLMLEKPLR